MTTANKLDLAADMIDVRDIIARVEAIESEGDDAHLQATDPETLGEVRTLRMILDDLEGNGGDEQFRGEWYPVTLIAEHYFTAYARGLLEDCDVIPADLPAYVHIDWQRTARDIAVDYSTVTIQGREYLYR